MAPMLLHQPFEQREGFVPGVFGVEGVHSLVLKRPAGLGKGFPQARLTLLEGLFAGPLQQQLGPGHNIRRGRHNFVGYRLGLLAR